MTRPVAALILAALIIAASAPWSSVNVIQAAPVGEREPDLSRMTGAPSAKGSAAKLGPDAPDPRVEPDRVGAPTSPAAPTTEPIPTPAPTSAISWIVDGIASTYGPGWDGRLALPAGRGIRVRICGPAACAVRVSNDAGPDLAMQRKGRVVDLDVPTFELVCGCKWTRGLVRVTVEGLRP